jgi:penicillin-binding protein 2
MIDPVQERRSPISPQLAVRVAALGLVALAVFGIIFFRLWYLQVLSGEDYLRQAADNRVRLERIQAPRGAIVDRQGRTLVDNKVATVVQLDPERLPDADRAQAAAWGRTMTQRSRRPRGRRGPPVPIPAPATAEMRTRLARLARVLDMSPRTIQERIVRSLSLVPYARITVRTDVPETMRNFLLERSTDFPGVSVDKTFLRRYPEHQLAAQLVGTVGEISPRELEQKRFRGVLAATIVGKEGLERSYDAFLRGVDGSTRITVDALGRPKGQARAQSPVPGRSVRLSLDIDLQRAGETALTRAIDSTPGVAGAFVALDPRDGKVLAMGSKPTYDPSVLSRPITEGRYEALFGEQAGSPRFNRAIGGQYPTGSTFKPVTALAGLAENLRTPDTPIFDNACVRIGEQERCNAKRQAHGTVALRRALQVSSDVYFYTLGRDLNPIDGQPLQGWARRLGFDRRTGIDLPSEFGGTIPDRRWRDQRNRMEESCRRREKRPCGIADGTNRPWTVGDNVNLAVGQGDIQATPLQMAVAYAAIANGGRVVRPQLGAAVEDANGRILQEIPRPPSRRVRINPVARQAIMDGLHLSTIGDGTSAAVFKDWDQRAFPVYGKTGTAQTSRGDQSWYVAYVPNPSRPIVIAATVEQGGFGAEAAAPTVRYMLGEWFGQTKTFTASASRNAE